MASKYTVICNHCGRRNSKSAPVCSYCGKPVELPLGQDDYYSETITRYQFSWYHDMGIKSHRKRGLVRLGNGIGTLIVGSFFLLILPEKLAYIGMLPAIAGMSMLPVAFFELIANRAFGQIAPWARWAVLLVGTLFMIPLILLGIIALAAG